MVFTYIYFNKGKALILALVAILFTLSTVSPDVIGQESDDDRLENPLMRAYEELLDQSDLDDDGEIDDLRKMIHDADKLLSKIKAENREALRNVNRQTPLPALPNILIILADDLSPQQLGCYGAEQSATPALDQLAQRSLVFENFHAGSPIDDDAFWTLWTGRTSNHIANRDKETNRPVLTTHRSTLLSNLWHAGYTTGFFGGWPLAGPVVPRNADMDLFVGWNDPEQMSKISPDAITINGTQQKLENDSDSSFAWTMTTMQALAALEREQTGRPFAYVLRYHALNIPASIADGDSPAERSARAFDGELTRLIDRIKTKPYANNTLIWIIGETADAGVSPDANAAETGESLQSASMRVPSVLFYPRRPAGVSEARLSAAFDVNSTLATVTRDGRFVRSPNGQSLLAPSVRSSGERLLYWSVPVGDSRYQVARYGKWKAVVVPGASSILLYDLEADPEQKNNVADQHPEILRQVTRSAGS